MAKHSKPEKMDWSDLTVAEINAVSITHSNDTEGTDKPAFPFLNVLFDELAHELKGLVAERNESILVASEIQAITKALINALPIKRKDELPTLSQAELKQYLLQSISLGFLIDVFNRLSESINTTQAQRLN